MGKFDDFNLDLNKVKNAEDSGTAKATSTPLCWYTELVTNSDWTCGQKSCMCSPSDMTACRNGGAARC